MIDSILLVVSFVVFSGILVATSKSKCSASKELTGQVLEFTSPFNIQGFSPAISFSILSISLNLS